MTALLATAQQHLNENELFKRRKNAFILVLLWIFDNMDPKIEYRFP